MSHYHGGAPTHPPLKVWDKIPVHLFDVNGESSFLLPIAEINQVHHGISIQEGPMRKVAQCTWTQLEGGNVGRTVICQDNLPQPPPINSGAWVVTRAKGYKSPPVPGMPFVVIQGPEVEMTWGKEAILLMPLEQVKGLSDDTHLRDVENIVKGGYIVRELPRVSGLCLTLPSTGPQM